MSQSTKFSLWQKLKQLLSTATTRSVANDADKPPLVVVTDDCDTKSSCTPTYSKVAADRPEQPNDPTVGSTPIVDCLAKYFDDRQWQYSHYKPQKSDSQQSHHLSVKMPDRLLDFGYLFRVQEQNKLLAIYGILPFLIPESHQGAAMLLITQINYDMLVGNLEMDVNDGEVRYKNAIDVAVVNIDDKAIEQLLQSVVAMTTIANELFSNLISNQDPTEDLQDLLLQLHQQTDSRTFYLPTQFVQ